MRGEAARKRAVWMVRLSVDVQTVRQRSSPTDLATRVGRARA